MQTEYFLKVPVDVVTYDDITQSVPKYIQENKQMTIASVNPQIILKSTKHDLAMKYINEAVYRIPDGIGIVKASKMNGGEIKERVTGIELMYKLLEVANDMEEKIFLYGAHPLVVKKAKAAIIEKYPKLEVAGTINGYTSMSDEEIVKEINQSQAKFLFVALGFPKQEEWIYKNASELNVNILEDVGGSLDVISGTVKRAPNWMINHHLEWLYRSLTSPKHFKRLFQVPVFMWKIWRTKERKDA